MKILKFLFWAGIISVGVAILSEDEEARKYAKSILNKINKWTIRLMKWIDEYISNQENKLDIDKSEIILNDKLKEMKKFLKKIDSDKIKSLSITGINKINEELNKIEEFLKQNTDSKKKNIQNNKNNLKETSNIKNKSKKLKENKNKQGTTKKNIKGNKNQ